MAGLNWSVRTIDTAAMPSSPEFESRSGSASRQIQVIFPSPPSCCCPSRRLLSRTSQADETLIQSPMPGSFVAVIHAGRPRHPWRKRQ